MSPRLQSLQSFCNPQCKGVITPYAPLGARGLPSTRPRSLQSHCNAAVQRTPTSNHHVGVQSPAIGPGPARGRWG